MKFRFLPALGLSASMVMSSCPKMCAYNHFEEFSHNFYEIERNDAELMNFYNEWGYLPRLMTGAILGDVGRRLNLRPITRLGDHLVKVENCQGAYKILYMVCFFNDGNCRIRVPRGLRRDGSAIRNLDKIDPIVFMQPFMTHPGLNLITLDDSWFNDFDREKLCEAGFVKNGLLTLTRENFVRYLFRRFSERNANLLARF